MFHAFSKHSYKLASAATVAIACWSVSKIESKITHSETGDTEFNFAAEIEARESQKLLMARQQRLNKFMPVFSELIATNRFALYDLLRKCKRNEYQIHTVNISILKYYNLVSDNGNVNKDACSALLDSIDKDRNYNARKRSFTC